MIVIDLGYQKVVLKNDKALQLSEILSSAERFEDKYWSKEKREAKGMTDDYTYHVYPNDRSYSMQIISDDIYRMAKLAGKPEKD